MEEQCIYSVSRAGLNRILVECAEAMPNVRFEFDHKSLGYTRGEGGVTLHLSTKERPWT